MFNSCVALMGKIPKNMGAHWLLPCCRFPDINHQMSIRHEGIPAQFFKVVLSSDSKKHRKYI